MQGKKSSPKASRGSRTQSRGSSGSSWPTSTPMPPPPKPKDKVVFNIGDLVMLAGERVIFRVKRRKSAPAYTSTQYVYDLVEVLNLLRHPDDEVFTEPLEYNNAPCDELARVTLVELGAMRLKLDTFIQEEVKRLKGDA